MNKKEYSNMHASSAGSYAAVYKIFKSLNKLHEVTPSCDIVLTGGEPFASLEGLGFILTFIETISTKTKTKHRVFINTSLPLSISEDETQILDFVRKYSNIITCLNISRNIFPYVKERSDSFIRQLKLITSVRIHSVLYTEDTINENLIYDFIKRFENFDIQFRQDYMNTTPFHLLDANVETNKLVSYINLAIEKLAIHDNVSLESKEYIKTRKSTDIKYLLSNGNYVYFHQTLPYSQIKVPSVENSAIYNVLYDIVIKQNGEIHSDWDYTEFNLKSYQLCISNENFDND
jgi:organic radical activating enzyme